MADYNIYIHSLGGGEDEKSPTSPFKPNYSRQTTPWDIEKDSSFGFVNKTPEYLTKLGDNGGMMQALGKVAPWVAAAIVVVKTVYRISKTINDFESVRTGDFRASNTFRNYEAGKSAIFHPVSTTIQTLKTMQINQIENQRRDIQRELLGDSEINYYTNRGV